MNWKKFAAVVSCALCLLVVNDAVLLRYDGHSTISNALNKGRVGSYITPQPATGAAAGTVKLAQDLGGTSALPKVVGISGTNPILVTSTNTTSMIAAFSPTLFADYAVSSSASGWPCRGIYNTNTGFNAYWCVGTDGTTYLGGDATSGNGYQFYNSATNSRYATVKPGSIQFPGSGTLVGNGASMTIGGSGVTTCHDSSIAIGTSGSQVLTSSQYNCYELDFAISLTGDLVVVLPATNDAEWVVDATGSTLNAHVFSLQANSVTWGTTIGVTNQYKVRYGNVQGKLYGQTLTP